jgi:hypothetical protein
MNFTNYFLNEAVDCLVSWYDEYDGIPYVILSKKDNKFFCQKLTYQKGTWIVNPAEKETVTFEKKGIYIKDPTAPRNKVELTNLNAVNAYVGAPS